MRLARPSMGRMRESARREVGVHQRLDLALDVVGQLEAVRPEQLDAVVLVGIVRGRDHDAEVGAHRAGQHGDGRRRHRAEQQHVHADRREAGLQGVFDHVAGQARVLADHDAVAVVAALEHEAGRLPDLQGEFRRDDAVGAAADAVGAEMLARHASILPRCGDRAGRAASDIAE